MRRLAHAMVVPLALGLAACGSLDAPDRVHDLRLLAMRADPPEQVFALPIAADAGFVQELTSADGGQIDPAVLAFLATQIAPVTITALVADPQGGGRTIHVSWTSCAQLQDNRCPTDAPGYHALGEGDATADGGWTEVPITFQVPAALLLQALQLDPYHGFGGLPLPVQLTLRAGNEEVVGFKRVVFTLAFAGQPVPKPNQNPYIPALELDGNDWSDTEPPVLAERREYKVTPVVVPEAEEAYTHPTFEGGELQFREGWRYNFFATGGEFSSFSTGGTNNVTGTANDVDSKWKPRDEDGPQRVTFFVVVRDGRGGEDWTIRQAQFAPSR